jgi:hypothetical protein
MQKRTSRRRNRFLQYLFSDDGRKIFQTKNAGGNKMASEKYAETKKVILLAIFASIILMQLVSSADTATYDEILKQIQAIYDFVKYAVTIIAGLVLLFAGITYITSGGDVGKREKAKSMIMYVILGLIVIWAAPFIVKLVLGT